MKALSKPATASWNLSAVEIASHRPPGGRAQRINAPVLRRFRTSLGLRKALEDWNTPNRSILYRSESPLKLHRKIRAELRIRRSRLIMPVKHHVSILVTEPHLLRAASKVELHLAHHLDNTVRVGSDLDTNFGRNGHRSSSAMRFKSVGGNPGDIRNFNAVGGFNSTLSDHSSSRQRIGKFASDFRLKTTIPIGSGTHDDLVEAVCFNLVRQVLQSAVFANFFPRAHGSKMTSPPISSNFHFSLS